jgi:hypothetical protein
MGKAQFRNIFSGQAFGRKWLPLLGVNTQISVECEKLTGRQITMESV